jgi:hypothetical protein
VLIRRQRILGEDALAEGAGFEPAIRSPAYTLSRRAPSTTRPPLRRPHSRVRLALFPAMRIFAKVAHYSAASSRRKRAPTAIADKVRGGSVFPSAVFLALPKARGAANGLPRGPSFSLPAAFAGSTSAARGSIRHGVFAPAAATETRGKNRHVEGRFEIAGFFLRFLVTRAG